jgi:hypothetical protein
MDVLKMGVDVPRAGIQLLGKITRLVIERAKPGWIENVVHFVMVETQ